MNLLECWAFAVPSAVGFFCAQFPFPFIFMHFCSPRCGGKCQVSSHQWGWWVHSANHECPCAASEKQFQGLTYFTMLVFSWCSVIYFFFISDFFFLDFPLVPTWSPPICTNSCSISTVLKWILAIHIDSIIGLFVHHIKLHVWLGSNCFPSFLFVLLSLFHFHFNFGTLEFSCEFLTCVSFIGLWVSCIRCNIRRWRK